MQALIENVTPKIVEDLGDWSEYLAIRRTWTYDQFMLRPEKTIALFTGNQWGKNVNIVKHYIARIFGKHPIEDKNMRPEKDIRTYRFCCEVMPFDSDGEDGNTIYPVLLKMLPKHMIKKYVSQRRPVMTLIDPQGGRDVHIEFSSYGQDVQRQAGKQRASVYIDENCNREFYEEQAPRLLASDGDIVIGMTPALGQITWQFESIYEKARTIIRTKRVRERIKSRFNEDKPAIEVTGHDTDICVLMAASDDNPYYDELVAMKNEREKKLITYGQHPVYKNLDEFTPITKGEYIKSKLEIYDEESEDVRRYGIFRQISGRIFKDFDTSIHVINENKQFPNGIPHDYLHGRGIDYHEHVDWHVGFMAISPSDEAFIYDELVASPEKYVTLQMAQMIADRSKDYKYYLSKIDPLATKTQVNTGVSTVDDLNRIFYELRREGIGTGGYWTSWDTKSTRGREEVRKRLKNSRICGTPFNNKQMVNGRIENLPTLWVLSNCRQSIDYLKNWRLEEWANRDKLETKEQKETPQQRYSHLCMVYECLFKENGFRGRGDNRTWEHIKQQEPQRRTASNYGRHN